MTGLSDADLFNHTQVAHQKLSFLAELFGAAIGDLRAGRTSLPSVDKVIEAAPAGSGKRAFLEEFRAMIVE